MSNCLNEVRIRAVADDEATRSEREHVETCDECRVRVDAARRAADELTAMSAALAPPAALTDSVRRSVVAGEQTRPSALRTAGATTLRQAIAHRPGSRVWLTAAAAAAAVLAIVFALPAPDAPRTISAAEILDRSLQVLAPATGVELREFDLELQPPRMASLQRGTYRMEQLIDHATPGRFRAARYAPDGTLIDAISQDPAAGRRTIVVNLDGQLFAFQLTAASGPMFDLPAMERQHVEAMVRVLQAMAGDSVREVTEAGAKRYVIEMPAAASSNVSGVWSLSRARVTIDADDFQILELTAAGSYMGDAVSVAFRLRNRQVWASGEVPSSRFEAPAAGAMTIDGTATEDIGRDVLTSALRALAKPR
jgi:hypothetical protein